MELREFIHDENPVKNRELFGLLGEYAASAELREALGGAVGSEPGRRWFILTGEEEDVMAFGSLRLKDRKAYLLHLHALKGEMDICILERCIQEARKAGVDRLITVDYWTRRKIYFRYGFAPMRKIGRFMRFRKDLGHES